MKSAKQILDFILNNKDNYESCLEEIETQLQCARVQGIASFDTEFASRNERQLNPKSDYPTRAILYAQPENISD